MQCHDFIYGSIYLHLPFLFLFFCLLRSWNFKWNEQNQTEVSYFVIFILLEFFHHVLCGPPNRHTNGGKGIFLFLLMLCFPSCVGERMNSVTFCCLPLFFHLIYHLHAYRMMCKKTQIENSLHFQWKRNFSDHTWKYPTTKKSWDFSITTKSIWIFYL